MFCVGCHEPDGLRRLSTRIMEDTLTHSSFLRLDTAWSKRPSQAPESSLFDGIRRSRALFQPGCEEGSSPIEPAARSAPPPCPMPRNMGHAHMAAHVPRNAQYAIKPRRPWCKHCHVVSCGVLCYAPAPSCLTCLAQARRVRQYGGLFRAVCVCVRVCACVRATVCRCHMQVEADRPTCRWILSIDTSMPKHLVSLP